MSYNEEIALETETTETTDENQPLSGDLIYGLEDRPPVAKAIFAAIQHVLASVVGIVTPSLIISDALGLSTTNASFLISMSLFVSGIATFIQARRFGPIGSGLLSIQGTSFTFIGPILAAGGAVVAADNPPTDALALIFGLCLAGSFIQILVSRFLKFTQKIVTPLVTGTVVTLIGLTLVRVGITDMGGGFAAKSAGTFGSLQNLGVAGLVLLTVLILNSLSSPVLRMGSIVIGLVVGYLVAIPLGMVSFEGLGELPPFTVPLPFRYGLNFDFAAFVPFIFLYVITTIESIGDLTATSVISGQPIRGDRYFQRLQGGVLADGLNSLLAACFNTFPNTTFSQNNGVIQLTGIGSRYVGYFISGIFVLLGLIPIFAGIIQAVPKPVLGGATILMFGTVAAAGIKLLSCVNLTRRNSLIIAMSLGLGLGVTFSPDILEQLPPLLKNIFSSGIATGGITALVLNLFIPGERE
ncbi:MAG: xanthine permease XanP [Cyanobacteria bacterium]|jgi:xanthine permease XanP|nr:xanthine permease XanP [Cyanobacteria bacterium GSL.Bin21]